MYNDKRQKKILNLQELMDKQLKPDVVHEMITNPQHLPDHLQFTEKELEGVRKMSGDKADEALNENPETPTVPFGIDPDAVAIEQDSGTEATESTGSTDPVAYDDESETRLQSVGISGSRNGLEFSKVGVAVGSRTKPVTLPPPIQFSVKPKNATKKGPVPFPIVGVDVDPEDVNHDLQGPPPASMFVVEKICKMPAMQDLVAFAKEMKDMLEDTPDKQRFISYIAGHKSTYIAKSMVRSLAHSMEWVVAETMVNLETLQKAVRHKEFAFTPKLIEMIGSQQFARRLKAIIDLTYEASPWVAKYQLRTNDLHSKVFTEWLRKVQSELGYLPSKEDKIEINRLLSRVVEGDEFDENRLLSEKVSLQQSRIVSQRIGPLANMQVRLQTDKQQWDDVREQLYDHRNWIRDEYWASMALVFPSIILFQINCC